MNRVNHLFVIPDGSRRHAKREYLVRLLRQSRGSLRAALSCLSPEDALALEHRIERYAASGEDSTSESSRDLLDGVEAPPLEYLDRSYQQGARVIDSILRWLLSESRVRVLTVYGMQTSNLCRTDDEVEAFMEVEANQARSWAADGDLTSRCSFAIVGDRAVLRDQLTRSNLRAVVARYIDDCDALERSGTGSELRVNILAPYDYTWEINQAVVNGAFDKSALVIKEDVELVFRAGSLGRSATSGALPCQAAFASYQLSVKYFPDCSAREIERAIARVEATGHESGL